MPPAFDQDAFYGLVLKGNVRGVMDYLRPLPEKAGLWARYVHLFEEENWLSYASLGLDPFLDGLLQLYQKYYHEVFYILQDKAGAADRLRRRLAGYLRPGAPAPATLDKLEDLWVAPEFERRGLHFLGGRSDGCYGPYVWRSEELKTYRVQLPEGVQEYTVKLLDDFICRSWVDYLSFGELGTGGWSNGDGLIHCVRSAYDPDSEAFRVSLLKHEAQHAWDLARWPRMNNPELEYRAKLVELIYTRERPLLPRFAQQAEVSGAARDSGHAQAARQILRGLAEHPACPPEGWQALETGQLAAMAQELFARSSLQAAQKYG